SSGSGAAGGPSRSQPVSAGLCRSLPVSGAQDPGAARGARRDLLEHLGGGEVLPELVVLPRAVEVAAAGDQQIVSACELPQPGALLLVVLAVVHLDAVQARLGQRLQQRQRQVVVPGDGS